MKCLRGADSEIVDFTFLDSDYTKIAFCSIDRNIEFHAAYGKHYKTRVPKAPRHMIFNEHGKPIQKNSINNTCPHEQRAYKNTEL